MARAEHASNMVMVVGKRGDDWMITGNSEIFTFAPRLIVTAIELIKLERDPFQ